MDLSLEKILTYLLGSIGGVTGLFYGIKYVYELLEKRADKRRADKRTSEEKAYEAVWKLYEDKKSECEKLKQEIIELEKGDSLSRPVVSKIYQAVRKLGRQIEILDTVFLKEFFDEEITSDDLKALCEAVKKEMEILWQKFDELEKCLP